ncbi:MAG: hypothetical protein WCH13_11150, partial [Deltaproteobacteria bacterium]
MANVALLTNIIVLLGIMCSLNVTYTLPGIAGIVLTVGMAVDANVLIFERLREEMAAMQAAVTRSRGAVETGAAAMVRANVRVEAESGAAVDPYASLVTVVAGTSTGDERVAATNTADGVRIVRINDYSVDVRPGGSQRFLAIENTDRPGTIGRVGTLMGQRDVNIS